MHEAYGISHLLTQIDQIEAIAAYDGHLLLGTRMGCLRKYTLALNSETQKYEVQLEYYCKTFSKKPIQQIEVIPEENLFLCLTDNILGIYDLKGPNFSLKTTFQKTKGASLFCYDTQPAVSITGEANSLVRLCVAVKKKLQLYFGRNGKFSEHSLQFTLPDVPKVLAWGKKYLCAGFKSEYQLFNLSTGAPKELFPTSRGEPILTKLTETRFLLGRGDTTVLVDEINEIDEKEVTITNYIKWEEAPLAMVWDEPFALGLLQNKVVVRAVEPQLFIQTLPELNNARLIYRCKRGLLLVASVGQVWILSWVDVCKQREQLIKDKHYTIALALTELSDLPEEEKRQETLAIRKHYARELFDIKEYSKSMDEYITLNTSPVEVIKLFSDLESKLGTEDLPSALNGLIGYLTKLRFKYTKQDTNDKTQNSAQQLELIDTTLLKCYLQTNDALVAPLLRLNNCRLDEAERLLLKHSKFSELIILYQLKGHHGKALQLLKEQATQPDSTLKGFQRTKSYLQNLGPKHLNLIFKFSDWILVKHPEEGIKIFTENVGEVEKLPRASVLDFLLREHDPLVIPYLEHIIHVWGDTTPAFHDALITKYREKVLDKGLVKVTEEERAHTKSKLLSFLEESTHYTPERVLLHFPTDSLFHERAIVLGKLGRYEQALSIYVQILGDVPKAIQYCERVTERSKDKAPDLYVTLMRILMNPEQTSMLTGPLANVPRHPGTVAPDLETTLEILEKHADQISPMKALEVLPESVPLARLENFLKSALDSQLTLKRRTQLLKGLLFAEYTQVQELKRYHESKSAIIHDYNVCPVCKKRFGNQSAFVRYPNGDIVHFSCRT